MLSIIYLYIKLKNILYKKKVVIHLTDNVVENFGKKVK